MKALIVVDMQKAFEGLEVCKASFETAIPNIVGAIRRFRDRKELVVFTRTSEALKVGPPTGWELIADLEVTSQDRILDKDFPNAFWETQLEENLRELSVDSVVICGCFSMSCVYLTYNGALERRFESRILENGTVSSSRAAIEVLAMMTESIRLDDL